MASSYNTNTTGNVIVNDLADQIAEKVILTTGVSPGGLGASFVEQIASAKPKLLILAARSLEKLQTTAKTIGEADVATKLLELDLSSLAHVRQAAETVNSWTDVPAIDVLVNNAGIMATAYGQTEDGFVRQLGTNHLGPFLFTNLILDKILAAKEPRVVTVASDGHRLSPIRPTMTFTIDGGQEGETYNEWLAYGQSKTANMLMTLSLAEKRGSQGLTALSLHPGVVGTNLGGHIDWEKQYADLQKVDRYLGNFEGWTEAFDFKSPERGVATHIYAAFAPKLKKHNGAYLLDGHVADPSNPKETVKSWATNAIEAERLWKLSEELLGQRFLRGE